MSFIYEDSVLRLNEKYIVQDVSKFPKDKSYMIGNRALLRQVVGTTAHINYAGRMLTIPVRSLIHVKGYKAKSVHVKNAEAFVVVSSNSFGIPVGTAFFSPTEIKKESITFEIDNKVMKLPLDLFAFLVSEKEQIEKETKVKVKPSIKELPSTIVNSLDQYELRKDINKVPDVVQKLLPNLNLIEIKERLYKKEDVFFDYEGNGFNTIAEADISNTKYRYKMFEESLIELIKLNLQKQFEAIVNGE